ncbi:MAG: DUF4177 domain-containing protein [Alphaproteobacteria bacterium]|nr:MAG: DUF4177 domain-containing protein [Alphaproteobacteria bacterium]
MAEWEYKVVPAPRRGIKARGAHSSEERFACALTERINEMAREGWEYVRSESLPCEERHGVTGRVLGYQTVMVFRREIAAGERFFALPEQERKRLEHHPTLADDDGRSVRPAVAPVSVVPPADTGRPGSILSLLKARRARDGAAEDGTDRLAAE